MKSIITAVVALSGLAAAYVRGPACEAPAPWCKVVPASSSRICSSIIASRHIPISTCDVPVGTTTTTSTKIVTPTTTITKTVNPAAKTRTVTATAVVTNPIRPGITTVWITLTSSSETLLQQTDTTTITTTTTSVETDTSTTTITSTSTSTSAVSWAPEPPCSQPVKRSGEYRERDIPPDCSCFLTTTKSSGPEVTHVVTKTSLKCSTKAITKTITKGATPTVTVTKTVTTHVNGAPPPEQTVTSTATSTVIDAVTTTILAEETSTDTVTSTTTVVTSTTSIVDATATQTEDPCSSANLSKYLVNGIPSSPNVVVGFQGDGNNDPSACCQDCNDNSGCVYWSMSRDGSLCQGFFVSRNAPVEGCTSQQCYQGHPSLSIADSQDDNIYGMGKCGNFGGQAP